MLVICEALSNGGEVPGWAREALPLLPGIMAGSDQLASRMERLALDTVERQPVDLILMDIQMSEMDGFQQPR